MSFFFLAFFSYFSLNFAFSNLFVEHPTLYIAFFYSSKAHMPINMCPSLVNNHLLGDLETTCNLAILVDIQEPNQDLIHNNNGGFKSNG